MAIDQESFNVSLYNILKTRGYRPVPKDLKNQRTQPESAEVFNFTFTKEGKDYGDAWVTIDDAQNLILYYDNEQEESPSGKTHGLDYDDSWFGLKKLLKRWAMSKQLAFELKNKDKLGDDMAQRDYVTKKEKMTEGYHPMGKKASYNDNIPAVKIILQHNRQIEEGEQRYRNIAKIYLENTNGERFLAPTTRPGIAQVYARHIAEGGVPNDERWNHIKSLCEEYSKMAGFIRATKNKQFNESAQQLVNEGINHYQSLRETLGKLRGHRGYNQYFESWTPALMEDETDSTQINELFVQETVDPRIESVMPILSRLYKKTGETTVKEVKELEQWADSIVEGSEWERRHDEFVRVGEKVTSQEVRSIIEQLKKLKEVADKKSGMLNQIFGKVSNQRLAMDSFAAEQFIRTLTRLIDAKPGTDERKELGQIVTYAKSLLRKATYLPNQDSMMAEGEDDIFRTSINDFDPEDMEVSYPPSPVESAILRRITHGRPDLLKHGPKAVLDAVKEVADFVGDVDEIGSSDVSGWIKQVERILGHKEIDEDLSSMMRKGAKKVQRAFSFWDGSAHLEDLKDYVKNASDQTLIRLAKTAKDDPKLHSPRAVQIKLIDRELKRRYGLTPKGNIKPEETLEGLDKNQKKAGQLGPTEKVGKKGAVGKLVGVSESSLDRTLSKTYKKGARVKIDNPGDPDHGREGFLIKTRKPGENTLGVRFDKSLVSTLQNIKNIKPISESVNVEEGTPEHEVIMDLINGNLDAYDVMNYPKTPAQQQVAAKMQERYDDIASQYSLHADDDFEKILDKIVDELADDYDNSGYTQAMSESINVEEGTPEHEVIMDLINGNLDAYDVMNNPKTPAQQKVAVMMQSRYDDIASEHMLHADDDFEKILDKIVDELADDYDTSGYTQTMSESELADLSKVKTEKLQELVALFRHYGQKDPRVKAAAERGAAELKKRGIHVPIDEGQEDLDAIKRLMK